LKDKTRPGKFETLYSLVTSSFFHLVSNIRQQKLIWPTYSSNLGYPIEVKLKLSCRAKLGGQSSRNLCTSDVSFQ